MSSKKGASAASSPAPSPATTVASTGPAFSRGSMTANGTASAMQFLSARWRAVEAAAKDPSLAASDKPEFHREKAANTTTAPAANQVKTGGQAKGGSPWGRRH